jgi:hypothetical protein
MQRLFPNVSSLAATRAHRASVSQANLILSITSISAHYYNYSSDGLLRDNNAWLLSIQSTNALYGEN